MKIFIIKSVAETIEFKKATKVEYSVHANGDFLLIRKNCVPYELHKFLHKPEQKCLAKNKDEHSIFNLLCLSFIFLFLNIIFCLQQGTPKLSTKRKSVYSRKLRPQSTIGKPHGKIKHQKNFEDIFFGFFPSRVMQLRTVTSAEDFLRKLPVENINHFLLCLICVYYY